MMFNTDFEMFYDLTLNETTAEATCKLNHTCGETNTCDGSCPKATTFAKSLNYAKVSFSSLLELQCLSMTKT
jgi:hypothetical protein